MFRRSTKLRTFRRAWFALALVVIFGGFPATARATKVPAADLFGTVRDPQGVGVANVSVALLPSDRVLTLISTTDTSGHFEFHQVLPGIYYLTAEAPGFADVSSEISLLAGQSNFVDLQFAQLAAQKQQVTVIASEPAALFPDPSERTLIHDELLDANPGSRARSGMATRNRYPWLSYRLDQGSSLGGRLAFL